MAEAAASKALASGGVAAGDVDFVLVATCTMPEPVPPRRRSSPRGSASHAPGAYDISSGCSGFVYALGAADAAIRAGQARNVLVVASERFSGWLDMTDRSTCIILGDGAGAAVVGPSDRARRSARSSGARTARSTTRSRSTARRASSARRARRSTAGPPARWRPIALAACERAGVDPSEIAAFVPHQANLRIIEALAKRLGAPRTPSSPATS